MRPAALITACLASHRRVVQALHRLSDAEFEHPSLLPDWTRADVVAWLALKSRSHVLLIDGASSGEQRCQFPRDYDQPGTVRNEAAQGATRLRSRLVDAFAELEAAWERLPEHLWTAEGITTAGRRSMADLVGRHLRDVEVHHVDLDVDYAPSDWPLEFVELETVKRLRDLDGRADPAALLAWLLGRGPAPELGPW
jgi:maleylpyruvate isomerase